jgi:hypothetical protein
MLKFKVNTNGTDLLSLISQFVLTEEKDPFLKQTIICEPNGS